MPPPGSEQPEFDAGFGKRRFRRCNAQVTRQCEFHSTTAGGTVDAGNDRPVVGLYCPRDALALPDELFCLGTFEVGHDIEVGPGTEGVTLAGQVKYRLRRLVDGSFEGVEAVAGERVTSVRA